MAYITILLLIANLVFTYQGLKQNSFFNKYSLLMEGIHKGEYYRIFSSAFLHIHWQHFAFNMITLWLFGSMFEIGFGILTFTIVYIGSIIASSGFVIYMYKKYARYSAVGASGAVSGLINASIVLYPGMEIGLFAIIFLPSWLYGLGYTIYSIRGMLKRDDGICHEGHFGGGIAGLVIGLIFNPNAIIENYFPIMAVAVPSLFFLIYYFFFSPMASEYSVKSIFNFKVPKFKKKATVKRINARGESAASIKNQEKPASKDEFIPRDDR